MVTPQSPTRMFNGLDEDMYRDAQFAHEINDKMRVPKRIKATGEFTDEDFMLSNQNGFMNSWNYHDKIDMNVPDRIVVLGHNQHLETRSAPREIQLENSLLPKTTPSNYMRVQTPPRVITLNDHHFPSASESDTSASKMSRQNDHDDDDDEAYYADDTRNPSYIVAHDSNMAMGFHPSSDAISSESESQVTSATGSIGKRSLQQSQALQQQQLYNNNDMSMVSVREGATNVEWTVQQEIRHLRNTVSKLNRRVVDIEVSNDQRVQRERIVYCFGLAYFVLKAIMWLNRN